MRNQYLIVFISFLMMSGFSCKKQEQESFNNLIDIGDSNNSQMCPAGGIIIRTGIDKNRNNILDSVEVDNSRYVCNGQNGAEDKQILLPIDFSANTTSTSPVIGAGLIKFTKSNYVGVDSIILVANPYVADAKNTAIVELYNITDNVAVNNGTIISNNLYSDTSYIQTRNVYNALPQKEVMLGISLKSGNEGMFAATGKCYLLLFRP
jgi:hypothetical protein